LRRRSLGDQEVSASEPSAGLYVIEQSNWEVWMPRISMPCVVAVAILATAITPPGLAQPAPAPSPGAPSPPAAGPPPATGTDEAAVEAGRLRKTHGGWRASRVVGATVFNDGNERIGTISDLIVTPEGGISEAVLSVGGFLGIGAKLVGVPYDQLQFEARSLEQTTAVAGAPAARDPAGTPATSTAPNARSRPAAPAVVTVRVLLPGATRDSLTALPDFTYE
jgi:hypothetical protein